LIKRPAGGLPSEDVFVVKANSMIKGVFLLLAAAGLAATAHAQYNRPAAITNFHTLDLDSNGHMHHHEVHQELDRKFEVSQGRAHSLLLRGAGIICIAEASHPIRYLHHPNTTLPLINQLLPLQSPSPPPFTLLHWKKEKNKAEFDAWQRHFDKNDDGKVLREEYFATQGSNEGYWKTTDLNQDGIITRSEAKEARDLAHPNRVQTYLKYFDTDGDGKISKDEFDKKHID
jgi:hypothetical protein